MTVSNHAPTGPMVFTTVGTDHHPFDRLVGWAAAWHARNPQVEARVQYGTSQRPDLDGAEEYLTYERMAASFGHATAVVCHGGPATIMDARYAGRIPLVIPRRSAHGEHVDDHQVRFTNRLAELDQIILITTEDELHAALDRAVADPDVYALDPEADDTLDAVRAFARNVRALGPT